MLIALLNASTSAIIKMAEAFVHKTRPRPAAGSAAEDDPIGDAILVAGATVAMGVVLGGIFLCTALAVFMFGIVRALEAKKGMCNPEDSF